MLVFSVRAPEARSMIGEASLASFASDTLTRDQERSLWLHLAVAGRLVRDPDGVLQSATAGLHRLQKIHTSGPVVESLTMWEQILAAGPQATLDALTSRQGWAADLRQNTPFARVLTERERQDVVAAFRGHWRPTAPG